MKKLIALDCDGTLLNSQKTISQFNIDAIKQAIEQGFYVCLSTGRSLARAKPFLETLNLNNKNNYSICFNGGYIANNLTEQTIYTNPFSTDEVMEVFNLYDPNYTVLLHGNGYIFSQDPDNPNFKIRISSPYTVLPITRELIDKNPIYKITIIHETENIEILYNKVNTALKNKFAVTASPNKFMEVTPKNNHKGFGLKQLCNYLNVDPQNVYVFGDAENDLTSFEYAGNSYALKNAVESLKQIATSVIESNDDNGVGKQILRLIKAT